MLACMLFLLFGIYNLDKQYPFNGDSARDTLKSLRILYTKDITIIGPPLSLGLNTMRETYFSSLIYYLTAGMLLISNNSILAPVFLMTLINATGIIPLYLMLKKRKLKLSEIVLLLTLYVTSPEIISYSRILWNPSPLIGLSVWGIYTLNKSAIIFGIVAGVCIYFHYFAVLLLLFGIMYYWNNKQSKNILYAIISFIVILSPFIFFEIKNKFYLTTSFIYNLQNFHTETVLSQKLHILLNIPTQLLGLVNNPFTTKIIHLGGISASIGLIIWIILIYTNRKNIYFILFIIAALFTVIASKEVVGTQYLFIAIGALIAYCINIKSQVAKIVLGFIICIQIVNTIYIINTDVRTKNEYGFPTIAQLEQTNQQIQQLHTYGSTFNVTENVEGDARALYIRYFLERDNVVGLQNETQYENLDELYILTPSLEKTLKEKRWEFTATSSLVKTHEIPIGTFTLLRYQYVEPIY